MTEPIKVKNSFYYEFDVVTIPDTQIVKVTRNFEDDTNISNEGSTAFSDVQMTLYWKTLEDLDNVILCIQEIKNKFYTSHIEMKKVNEVVKTTSNVEVTMEVKKSNHDQSMFT